MTHIEVAILNTMEQLFKIYEKHQFLFGKTEKFKIAVFFPAI